jgi:hypothetical protein
LWIYFLTGSGAPSSNTTKDKPAPEFLPAYRHLPVDFFQMRWHVYCSLTKTARMQICNWNVTAAAIEWSGDGFQRFEIDKTTLLETIQSEDSAGIVI